VKTAQAGTSATGSQSGTSKSSKKSSKKKSVATAARRPAQQQPTPERYKEIQQALADKGYFSGLVDGNWGPESVAALKRFQRDQNLADDGKIGSLSLIALGLGPQRVAAAQPATPRETAPPAAPVPPTAPAAEAPPEAPHDEPQASQ